MTVDYTHILSFDPIIYRRKQSDSTPSLVYRVKMPVLAVNTVHMGVTTPCLTITLVVGTGIEVNQGS